MDISGKCGVAPAAFAKTFALILNLNLKKPHCMCFCVQMS